MSTKRQLRQSRKQSGQAATPSNSTSMAQTQQAPSVAQQSQWLSTNAGVTPNLEQQNPMGMQASMSQLIHTTKAFTNQAQPSIGANVGTLQDFGQLAMATYSPQATSPQTMAAPGQMSYGNYDVNQTTSTTTTTTTTTTQSTQHSGSYGQQYFDQPLAQLTGQLQNMQIQQPYLEQQIQTSPPPVVSLNEAPPMQQQPAPQRPALVGTPPAMSQQKEQPVAQQDPRYPVTTEQRQSAWFQWRAEHSTKPQRTLDRTMQEYMSGKKDKQIYETLITQQQFQQLQNHTKPPQCSKELRKADKDQKRQDRQREREERQQQREEKHRQMEAESMQQWQNMPQQWGGQGLAGLFGGFGGSMVGGSQNITTTQTVQMVTQQGVTSQSGENRKKAIAEGPEAVQQLELRIQQMIAELGVCPMFFAWVPDADASGYMCCGGNHFISDQEIDLMLANDFYHPQHQPVNHLAAAQVLEILRFGATSAPLQFLPLKKPPPQVPRFYPCWGAYEGYSQAKQIYESQGQEMALSFLIQNGAFG